MAVEEKYRLRLLVIKLSTTDEGVRYLITLFSPTCRENPPACPVCRGLFGSMLLTMVSILCEVVPSCRFSCFTFLVPAKEKSRTHPCGPGEAGFSCFERRHIFLGELQKLPRNI